MKNVIIIIIILSLFSCKSNNKTAQLLTDTEWREIISQTIKFPRRKIESQIYKDYNNIYMRDTVIAVYEYCSYLGYEVNDSIIDYIKNRKNKPITNRLDTMYGFSFTLDTINNHYITYSEPFFVNDKMICVSMSSFNIKEDTSFCFVYFFKKENGSFKEIEFYDVRKNLFYECTPVEIIGDGKARVIN